MDMIGILVAAALTAADFGPPLTKDQAVAAVQTWAQNYLKDADSAKYEFKHEVLPVACHALWKKWYGYGMEFRMNAKNSYGAYTGYDTYTLLVTNERGTFEMDVFPAALDNFYSECMFTVIPGAAHVDPLPPPTRAELGLPPLPAPTPEMTSPGQ